MYIFRYRNERQPCIYNTGLDMYVRKRRFASRYTIVLCIGTETVCPVHTLSGYSTTRYPGRKHLSGRSPGGLLSVIGHGVGQRLELGTKLLGIVDTRALFWSGLPWRIPIHQAMGAVYMGWCKVVESSVAVFLAGVRRAA